LASLLAVRQEHQATDRVGIAAGCPAGAQVTDWAGIAAGCPAGAQVTDWAGIAADCPAGAQVTDWVGIAVGCPARASGHRPGWHQAFASCCRQSSPEASRQKSACNISTLLVLALYGKTRLKIHKSFFIKTGSFSPTKKTSGKTQKTLKFACHSHIQTFEN
jgi:hypothetical protein